MKTIILFIFTISAIFANIIDLKSFQAEFIQQIKDPNNQIITYKGTLYIQNNNVALWHYTSPVDKSIYIKQDNVIVVEPELEQIMLRKFSTQPNFLKLLSNAKQISKNQYKTTFQDVDYILNVQGNIIESIHYQDQLDNNISIIFTTQAINTIIPDSIFEFEVPKDYDII